jgi:hypothetical protein
MALQESSTDASCKLCTIQLEELCYARAWWFRGLREVFATGVRIFSFVLRVNPNVYKSRSPMCKSCIRFRKNVLKCRSTVFNKLDSILNPIFNRIRDSLLTPEELERARLLARCAAEKQFVRPADLTTLSELY